MESSLTWAVEPEPSDERRFVAHSFERPSRLKVGLLGADESDRAIVDSLLACDDVEIVDRSDPLDASVEAVVVAGPTAQRADHLRNAAEAGKAVFLVVPDSADVETWCPALDAVIDAEVPCLAAFAGRFWGPVQRLKSAVSMGEVGRIHTIHLLRTTITEPDALPTDGLLGDLDLLRWLAGGSAVEVFALTDREAREDGRPGLSVSLRFATGTTATLVKVPRLVPYDEYRTEVFGSSATIALSSERPQCIERRDGRGILHEWVDPEGSSPASLTEAVWAHFVCALRRQDPHLAGPEDLRSALVMADAINLSIRTGQPASVDAGPRRFGAERI